MVHQMQFSDFPKGVTLASAGLDHMKVMWQLHNKHMRLNMKTANMILNIVEQKIVQMQIIVLFFFLFLFL